MITRGTAPFHSELFDRLIDIDSFKLEGYYLLVIFQGKGEISIAQLNSFTNHVSLTRFADDPLHTMLKNYVYANPPQEILSLAGNLDNETLLIISRIHTKPYLKCLTGDHLPAGGLPLLMQQLYGDRADGQWPRALAEVITTEVPLTEKCSSSEICLLLLLTYLNSLLLLQPLAKILTFAATSYDLNE